MIETPAYLRRARLGQSQDRVGQFREREALPAAWWRQLGELALLLILVGILTQGCDKLPPNVWPPADCRLWQTAIQAMPDGAARDAAQAEFDQAHPEGCPVTEPPSPPPTTLPPGPPPTTLPPPPEPGCTLAGAPSTALPEHRSTLGSLVNAVLLELHPECGYAGGTCVVNEETQQGLQRKVEAALRARGICAGQHEPWTDEIAVARVATDPWEGYRIFSGDDTEGPLPPGASRRTIQWAPPDGSLERPDGKGGYRAAWLPPVTTPTPAPTATPAGSCPAPRPESYRNPATKQDCTFVWGYGAHPAKWRDKDGNLVWGLDATLNVSRCCDFCKAIGMGEYGGQIRCQCPLRSEGQPEERELCEAEVGATWQARGGALVPNPGNRAQASCDGSGCEIRVCTGDGSACGEWRRP